MSRLTPEAEELVRAGRSVLRPGDADRERVFQALQQRLDAAGVGTEGGMAELSRAPAAAKVTLAKVSSVLVGLGVVGAGLFLALRPGPPANADAERPVPPAVMAPASTAGDAPVQPERSPADVAHAASEEPAPAPPTRPVEAPDSRAAKPRAQPARRTPAMARSEDSLAREVALLSRAGAELHAARPAAALLALAEHERKFPSGALAEERAAARARALCALGRTKEAQAELARLERASPGSPHAVRAARACASAGLERE